MAAVVLPDLLPLQPASLAVFLSLLLSPVLIVYLYSSISSHGRHPRPKLPPSPPQLPIIGNLHQIGRPPHHSLRALSRRHGPLMFLRLGQVPTLVVSSAEMAEEVLKTHDLAFASRPHARASAAIVPGGRGIGLAPYGEFWRQARRVCIVHLLSHHQVQRFRPATEEEVARLVGKISALSASGGPIDVSKVLSSFTSSVICRATAGESAVEEGVKGEIAELVGQSLAVARSFQVDNFFPSLWWLGKVTGADSRLGELAGRWRALLNKLVEDAVSRREAGGEARGLLDVLLSLQTDAAAAAGYVPSMDEIQAIILSMITAGTDPTYHAIESAFGELVRNPQAMKKAQDEVRGIVPLRGRPMVVVVTGDDIRQMGYLRAVIKEALRLHPSAPLLIPRESMEAVQIRGGYEIPSKTRVLVNAWAIARDPDSWESPEEFRPERFLEKDTVDFRGNDFQFIPFGAGRRICPGVHFAVATVELALANLLYHFDWSLPEGITAEELDTDGVRRKSGLLLVAKPRPLPR